MHIHMRRNSTLPCFYTNGNYLWLPVCFPGQCNPYKMESTLKGKNLLLVEQTLPLKVYPRQNEAKMKMVRVVSPLNVHIHFLKSATHMKNCLIYIKILLTVLLDEINPY